jgi:hypothetical protein
MRRWRGGRSRRVFSDDLGEQVAVGARALDDVEPRLRGRAGGGVERGLACRVENPGDAVGERARVADRNEDGVAIYNSRLSPGGDSRPCLSLVP